MTRGWGGSLLPRLALAFTLSCASTAPTPAPDPLAGCSLQSGPVALCDGGRTILDVAHAQGEPLERLAHIAGATDRPDDAFVLMAGRVRDGDDGSITRVDVVQPWHVPHTVGTVTYVVPREGDVVVACAAFDGNDGRCAARAAALLRATIAEDATLQSAASIAIPGSAPDGCSAQDDERTQRRVCASGDKLSLTSIDSATGPATAWWMLVRVALSIGSIELMTTCTVLGQSVPCALTRVAGQRALIGAALMREELALAACFFGPGASGLPPVCSAVFAAEPNPAMKLIGVVDVPLDRDCKLTQADERDGFARKITCADGSALEQLAIDLALDGENVACTVRGAPATCVMVRDDSRGTTTWFAPVETDTRVTAFACTSPSHEAPALCAPFVVPDTPARIRTLD